MLRPEPLLKTDLMTTVPEKKPSVQTKILDFSLHPVRVEALTALLGPTDANLRFIEQCLGLQIVCDTERFRLIGHHTETLECGKQLLNHLYQYQLQHPDTCIEPSWIQLQLQDITGRNAHSTVDYAPSAVSLSLKNACIKPRGYNQQQYLKRIQQHVLNFGVGPAGTGKTYLAVAAAVHALLTQQVKRIVLVRPVIEAGEHLGFLPGSVAEKIDPYLRPLYDAFYEMLGPEHVQQALQKGSIEIAPLAYMRGRTLDHAFVILDESQNATVAQMKMFLTRIGFHTTVVVTGDPSQIDLPSKKSSGLAHALHTLANVPGISFTTFNTQDVTRHPLVQSIVNAYAHAESATYRENPH